MRFAAVYILTLSIAQAGIVCADTGKELTDDTAKLNYSVGYQIGSDFKYQDIEVRADAIIKGIKDAMSGNEALMTSEEMNQTMADLGKKVTEIKQKQREEQAKDYAEKNRQFLVDNSKRTNVTTTKSGLQYRVVDIRNRNKRKHPEPDSEVMVIYTGKLIDGTAFDSSVKQGKPASFRVNKVIKGLSEALQLMGQGDHWQLFIPAELAYGDKGAGPAIPPNSTLIFDVELISIK